ncbi:PH domain protein [Cooperia oncophora]
MESGPCAQSGIEFVALSLLRSKKQYYFAIDELNGQLLYYKEEADLVAKREPIGALPLANAAFTILEGNDRTFVLHCGEKVVELEAPNPESCECWLEALSHRALTSQRNRRRRLRSPRVRKERKKCLSDCEEGPVDDYSLVPPLSGRKYSCSASHISSDMALSVLEKKFNDLEPLGRSHSSGIEDGSTDRVLSEVSVVNCLQCASA